MQKFWETAGRQLRNPHGLSGWMMGHLMCLINHTPNAMAISALDIAESDHVLEIGFGPGCALKQLAKLARHGHVSGIDSSFTMFAQAHARNQHAIRLGKMDLHVLGSDRLPHGDHSVDRILAVNVAYFLGSDGRALAEMRRVLKPGGKLVIYVTRDSSMKNWKFASAKTHRLFNGAGLRAMLENSAFRDRSIAIKDVRLFPGIVGLLAEVV